MSRQESRGPILLLLLMLANVISCQQGRGLPACRPRRQAAAVICIAVKSFHSQVSIRQNGPGSRRSDARSGSRIGCVEPFREGKVSATPNLHGSSSA